MRKLTTRNILLIAQLVVFLLPVVAGAVMVSGRGPLDDVNSDANTIEIRDTTFSVDSRSVLLGADGKATTLLKLEGVQAGSVFFTTRPGHPNRIVDRLQLVDENADDIE